MPELYDHTNAFEDQPTNQRHMNTAGETPTFADFDINVGVATAATYPLEEHVSDMQ